MKLRMPTKLGFKNPKHIMAMFVTNNVPRRLLGGPGLQLVQRPVRRRRGGNVYSAAAAEFPEIPVAFLVTT